MSATRQINQIIRVQPTSDGDGVKIQRVAGFNNAQFSPFLMVDELKSDQRADYVGGFPPHPHRGIETLTYMLKGHFQHRDHMGNVGELRSGGAQWMAAGRGVIHSEMPIMEQGDLHGFQIWINQPARDKMKPAKYHDFQPETITEYSNEELGLVRVLAGSISANEQPLKGPLNDTGVELSVSDWRSDKGHFLNLSAPEQFNMMVLIYKGSVRVGEREVKQGELALLTKGERVELNALEPSGLLIFAGEPINEPVVHYGPFVMNSMAEIEQTINDYNAGVFETY
ncbi:quercetin 2,3-dioxygenase [Vibrio galatheae]|uniref:Quercetin 2,3-dioxygenase n=1 Tax=Vibrio galatheae TaxID=579748 RepID=A0A0F4NJB5_9VIBR|nr:pirin family protein [Vibrio galatheae]KJY82141.1 quercetin 2,3-dioxygenase [Vibrio galatheae]